LHHLDEKYYIRCIIDVGWWQPPLKLRLICLTKEKYKYWGKKDYYYRQASEKDLKVIIQRDFYPTLYEVLGYYYNSYNLVGRIERYRNLYLAYEQLTDNVEFHIRAIRHSFSHSRVKLTNKKVREFLIENFGDVKINLKKYSHRTIFLKTLRELGIKCESIIVDKILRIIPDTPNLWEKYYYPIIEHG